MKKILTLLGLVGLAFIAAFFIVYGHDRSSTSNQAPTGMPWQIETLPSGGSKVFGLTLSNQPQAASTLAEVQKHWASDFQMAVVAAPGEDGTLEAYIESATMGFVAGRLIVTAQVSPDLVKGFREKALKSEFMNSTTRKYQLSLPDAELALQAPILALAFIPQAQLDAEMVQARFGQPSQKLRSNEHAEHWLYPDKGLSITLDSQGKELLQYVAPSEFSKLRDPLIQMQVH